MSGTGIATNPYLEKLKTRDLSQPTKLTEPGTAPGFVGSVGYPKCHVFKNSASPKLGALRSIFTVLERRCPDHVEPDRRQQAIADGRTFLARWGDQAHALGWIVRDLFGLLTVPEHAKPSFNRLSRYDETGLIWLLEGRTVVALTATSAAIQSPSGNVTIYRKLSNKPSLGPVGDSLDDLQ